MVQPLPDNPEPSGRLDADYAAAYRRLYDAHWWWRAREDHVARWARRVAAGRKLRTLDIGCGDGLAWPALEAICDCAGIEPDPRLVPDGSPFRDRITVAPFPGAQVSGGPFDLVLMLDVLEHIEDDRAAAREVFRLLAPGGHLLLTVPAMPSLWSTHDVINGHFRRYVRRNLVEVLESAGLTPLSVRYCSIWTVAPLVLRRLAFRREDSGGSAFVSVPPAGINALLGAASRLEHAASDLLPVPFGSSLIALARKN